MSSFPNFEPAHCSMSGSNCCLLTHIRVSQEKVDLSGTPISLRIIVIHTVRGFSVVNVTEIDVFLEFPCFPLNVGHLISGFSAFFKSSFYIWKFSVHVLLKPSLKDFEHILVSMWNEHNCMVIWIFFGIAFLCDWDENWPFPVLWPLLSFPNFLAYWV